jgi:nitroimidazol reductase NimA-like FMN-containing flavoprotein (pyridoxamine 5'-phosphate oxidase superfamily)
MTDRDLTQAECADLVASAGIGRVAICTADGPQVFPVNFLVASGMILFRTSAYGELGRALVKRPRIAFQVDHIEHERKRGWSVVARGTAEPMDDADAMLDLQPKSNLIPWAEGTRNLVISVQGYELSGRRVGAW